MNNYQNFKNINYTNMYNPYDNTRYDTLNRNSLYDPYNGFIRGNLFKDLYNPYKGEEPYEVKPMNEQAQLLTKIDALTFSLIDLNLLLDVNPEDKNMISLYNNYMKEKDNLVNEYENKYGPITLESNTLNSFPWGWIDTPWPWDN